jgi:hypothetical protein
LKPEAPNWPQAKYLGIAEQFIEKQIDLPTLLSQLDLFDDWLLGLPTNVTSVFMTEPPPLHSAATRFLSICVRTGPPIRPGVAEDLRDFNFALMEASFASRAWDYANLKAPSVIAARRLLAYTTLFHEFFGPLPFRDVPVDPEWLTFSVTALARGIYDNKDFSRMPILADALQDAGCDNVEILLHCRDTNHPHVRGCWVLDLLLGRPWRDPA